MTAFGFDDDSAELEQFTRWLCLACGCAGITGEPSCCAAIDHVPISPFVDADRFTWWHARMAKRTEADRASMSSAPYDRGRCYSALRRHAKDCGRAMSFAAVAAAR